MFCKYCGRQIADDSKFCEFCGNLIQRMPIDEPDIPASIGEPIFKETIFEEESAPSAPQATRRVERPMPVIEEPETPEEIEAPEPTKGANKGLIWGLIAGGVTLLAGIIVLLVLLFSGEKAREIELGDYADFKVTGYDGFGVATCEVDWDGLEVAVLGEFPDGSDSKSREKQVEYREKAAILRSGITLNFEKCTGVKIGDELEATFSVGSSLQEELNVVFIGEKRAVYTVKPKDLSGSSEVDLVAEFIDVAYEGVSGKGTATLIPKDRTDKSPYIIVTADGREYTLTVEFPNNTGLDVKLLNAADNSTETVHIDCALSKDKELAEGEKITLYFGQDADKALMEYGLLISKVEAEFEVKGLESYVTEFEQIDAKVLAGWKETYAVGLGKVVPDNWGYYFHGGNDLRPTIQTFEDVTCKQAVLITSQEGSELYLLYSAAVADDAILMDNFQLPRTYHFAVRLRGLFVDGEGKLVEDKVLLPELGTEDYIGAYLDYDELMELLTEDAEYILESE